MQTKSERIAQFGGRNAARDWLPVVAMIGSVSLALFPLSRIHAAQLQGEELVAIEGDDGVRRWEIPIRLDAKVSQPASVRFELRPDSAESESDFQPMTGQLVFVPESLEPGLSRPEESEDPFVRQLELEQGFGLDELAEVDNPVGLAFAPLGSRFGEALYAGSLDYTGIGVSDYIVRIDSVGRVEDVARLLPEADPTSLEFPPPGSRYGDFLFVSANNRDGQRAGDQGGTIQRIDVDGRIIDFTAIGVPFGPGEPGELAFGGESDFGDTLLLANSVGVPADIVAVTPTGALVPIVDDGFFEGSNAGLAPRSLAIDSTGNYDGIAYFGEFGRRCSCLRKLYPDGRNELWIDSLPGDPHSIVIAPEGVFGGEMFVAVDDGSSGQILRVTPDGTITPFLTGLQGFLHGNGKDVMEFSADGSVMYVADFFADRIYRVAPDKTLSIEIVGDRLAEPDETLEVKFFDPINLTLPETPLRITIENDDENDLPPILVADSTIELTEDGGPFAWAFRAEDDVTGLNELRAELVSESDALISVVSPPALRPNDDRFWVVLESAPDFFGQTSLFLSIEDEAGNLVEQAISVVVNPINDPPTLNPIPDVFVAIDSGPVGVTLEGITTGAANEFDQLVISALIENLSTSTDFGVEYESPAVTGRLVLPDWSIGHGNGPFVVAVRVQDGASANGELTRRFRVEYEPPSESPEPDEPVDLPPTVRMVSPTDHQVLSTDPGTLPGTTTIGIVVDALDDIAVSRVELFANSSLLAEFSDGPYTLDWEDVPVGDYELKAIAYDDLGQSAESEPVLVAVGERLGSVAIVRDHDDIELDRVEEYLFEMGLDSIRLNIEEVQHQTLSPFDLVVWHTTWIDVTEVLAVQVQEVARVQSVGTPFYFIGAASDVRGSSLFADELDLWRRSTGFRHAAIEQTEALAQEFVNDSANEILAGGFGSAAGMELPVPGRGSEGLSRSGQAIAFAGERPSMAMFPDLLGPDVDVNGASRVVHQTFWLSAEDDEPTERALKGLFQNSVCWLLRCPACHAVDLDLGQDATVNASASEQPFRYRVQVRHSGECDASGVLLRVPIPDGLELIDFDTDHGRVQVVENELFFSIGRLARAAEVNLGWHFRPRRAGDYEVVATLSANQVEVNDQNNSILWASSVASVAGSRLSIRQLPGRIVELRLEATDQAGYEIFESTDLLQWKSLGPVTPGRWTPLQGGVSRPTSFYQALRIGSN